MPVSLLLFYCLLQSAEDEYDMIRSGESEAERLVRGREHSCMIINASDSECSLTISASARPMVQRPNRDDISGHSLRAR